MEWQPIDTAPKDGTFILIIDGLGDLPFAKVSCWDVEKQAFWYPHVTKPEFWMPLPTPPINESTGK